MKGKGKMIFRAVVGACAFLVAASAGAECTGVGQSSPSDLAYICDSERAWAESVANGDVSIPMRILAADYIGIGSSGRRFTKTEMAAQPSRTSQFVASEEVGQATVRFFGNMAVSQGSETSRSKDGHTNEIIWTDTWLKRKGKWQIVASQDMIRP